MAIIFGEYIRVASNMHSSQTNFRDRHSRILERIAIALERLAPPVKIPNYQFPSEAFENFDWESIGASVEQVDRQGPSLVSWEGMQFQRREPANRFREAIWFARVAGKDERGELIYQRLITFRPPVPVGAIPEKVRRQALTNGAIARG